MSIPAHPEAEAVILGTCMDYTEAIDFVEEKVADPLELFWDERNKEVWRRIQLLRGTGKPVSMPMVATLKAEAAIDIAYVSELQDKSVIVGIMLDYLDIAIEHVHRRKSYELGFSLASSSGDGACDFPEVLSNAESSLYAMRAGELSRKTLKESVANVFNEWEWCHQNQGKINGISTGFPDLDRMTWGFQKRQLTIIGARPSQGKTALLCNMMTATSVDGETPSLFFSLESSMEEITRRIITSRGRLDVQKLRNGNFLEEDFRKIALQGSRVSGSHLTIIDNGNLSISQMRSIARRFKKSHGIRIVWVDYLQKAKATEKKEKRTYEVAQVSEGLKEMAKELDIPVVSAAQLNRESDREKGREPRISDLGDSGQIERDADIIMLLHRNPVQDWSKEAWEYRVLVGKNRDGPTGPVPLIYFPKFTRFESASRITT